MAITKLNYVPGAFEAITDEAIEDVPALDTWYYFKLDTWVHLMADIVLKQSAVVIPESAYELTKDTKYTSRETNESAKIVYAKFKITNVTYAGIATTISGSNFGTYVDNEGVQEKLDLKLLKLDDDLSAKTIVFTEWTDKGSGSNASDTYDLDVSNIQKYIKVAGTTYAITLSNGGSGSYIIKLVNGTGAGVTVTFSGGTIEYPAGETNFTLATGNTGLYTVIKDGTTHYITQTEF